MDNLQVEHKIEHGLYCKLDEEESAKYLHTAQMSPQAR
jgi:hypothetical protein